MQSIDLPPRSLMRRPDAVPLLKNTKTASYRDVERLAIRRGQHGAYMRQWVVALQHHTLDVADTKNGKAYPGDGWKASVLAAHRNRKPDRRGSPEVTGM